MNHVLTRRTPRRLVATMTAAALTCVLAACGSDDPVDGVAGPDPVEVQPEDAPSSPGDEATDAPAPQATGLVAAGRTAQATVPGSQVIHMDLEDAGEWEVDVALANGTEHEVRLSSDGSTVLRGPRQDDTDADDRRENSLVLDQADLDFEQALKALAAEVADTDVDELSLELEGNTVRWEIDLRNGDEYSVDAVTAAVTRR